MIINGKETLKSPIIGHYDFNDISINNIHYVPNIDHILIKIIGIDDNFMTRLIKWDIDVKNKREDLKKKIEEIDPYEEENWFDDI